MIHLDDCDYLKDEIMNPNCPKCMETWCKFIEKHKLYIATDKK